MMAFALSFLAALSLVRVYTLWLAIGQGQDAWLIDALECTLVGFKNDLIVALGLGVLASFALRRGVPARILDKIARTLCGLLLVVYVFNAEYFLYFGGNFNASSLALLEDWLASSQQFLGIGFLRSICVLLPVLLWVIYAPALKPFSFSFESKVGMLCVIFVSLAPIFKVPRVPHLQVISESYPLEMARGEIARLTVKSISETVIREYLQLKETSAWRYIVKDYPFVKITPHQAVALGLADESEWTKDRDVDGYPLLKDCDDKDFTTHPGAKDQPRNGKDEDCNGIDADPASIIFIHWEGARWVNVDGIGHGKPATPHFVRHAKSGVLFSSMYANATRTRNSLISIYCSALPLFSQQWIFADLPRTELLCFPEALSHLGYQSVYMHSGDANFAAKGARLRRWFDAVLDRSNRPLAGKPKVGWGPSDRVLFEEAWKYLDERKDSRPLFMTIATLSNHWPFEIPFDASPPYKPADSKENKIANLIHYSDEQIGKFLDKLFKDERYKDTLVIVAGDHGLNWYSPKAYSQQDLLYEDVARVAFALLGEGWNTKYGVRDDVRSLVDLAPTIFDQLGVRVPNPFVGSSLLEEKDAKDSYVYFLSNSGKSYLGFRSGNQKFFFSPFAGREASHLYELGVDAREERNLVGVETEERLAQYEDRLFQLFSYNNLLLLENKVWSWDFWIHQKQPQN